MRIGRNALIAVLSLSALELIARFLFLKTHFVGGGFFVFGTWVGIAEHLNTGSVFDVPIDNTVVAMCMVFILAGLLWYSRCLTDQRTSTAFLFVIAGAVLNLSSRVLYGGVVDYVHVPFGGVLNLADVMIVAGVLWFVVGQKK